MHELIGTATRDSIRDRAVPLPKGMVDPRVGVADIPGIGHTVIVIDALSPPYAWDPRNGQWREIVARS
jgi:hypothetical protein